MSTAAAPQVPSVGRIVHYRSRGSADGVFREQCRAAVITDGLEGTRAAGFAVALAVLNPTGLFFDQFIEHDETLAPGTWHWPGRDGDCRPAPLVPEFD